MPLDSTTSIALFGIQCWDEGTRENFVRSGASSATRTIVCGWANRASLINAMRGAVAQAGPTVIQYTPPAIYPDAPWLFVDAVEVEGIAGEGGLSVSATGLVGYKYARIKIVYKSLPYQEGIETGVLSVDFGAEWMNVSTNTPSFSFSDTMGGDVTTDQNPQIRMTTISMKQTRNNLPSIPVNTIVAATDTVNLNAFQGAAPGTVKFDGAASQRRLFANGSPGWDMTYAFTYRSVGWNVAYDAANGWRPIILKATGKPPFASFDYSQLFE